LTTYAIGDLQGCRDQLEQLLDRIGFDPASDRLWLAGDLVNRGPDSLGTLELLYGIREHIEIVLGNHDLHMLACARRPEIGRNKDTLWQVIESSQANTLLDWLEGQSLLIENDNFVMCHAGLYPFWSLSQARQYAVEVEAVLQSEQRLDFYRAMYGNEPEHWSESLTGMERLRFITNAFTRMRFVNKSNGLNMTYKGTIDAAPDGLTPWYQFGTKQWQGKTLLIGHWAALQRPHPLPELICLDSGCIWGGELSAYALETGEWYTVPGWRG
jgi:bis(5'-nucleosyl)-tetraphosphatase (symmetrical)